MINISPEAIRFIDTFKNWIAAGAVSLCVWFIIHFIKNREKFEDKMDKYKEEVDRKVLMHKENTNKQLADALTRINDAAQQFTAQIEEAREIQQSISQSTYEFQEKVIRDVARVQIEVNSVMNEVKNAGNQIHAVSAKMKLVYDQVDEIQRTIHKQQESLSLGATAMYKQRQRLDSMKSEIVKINEEIVMIKSQKKPQ